MSMMMMTTMTTTMTTSIQKIFQSRSKLSLNWMSLTMTSWRHALLIVAIPNLKTPKTTTPMKKAPH